MEEERNKTMNTDTASLLNDLIKISKDGEQGFRAAAEETASYDLKKIFMERANECSHAVQELQQHVASLNEEPENRGSLLGELHRGWLTLKSSLTGWDEHAILEECERGEDVAKAAYSKALNQNLPDHIRTLIQHQYEGVVKNHDLIKGLRTQYAVKKQP